MKTKKGMKRFQAFGAFLVVVCLNSPAFGGDWSGQRSYLNKESYRSIHFEQWREHEFMGSSAGFHSRKSAPGSASRTSRTVYGWYPYWQQESYVGFRWECLSHISFFSLETNASGDLTDVNGWPGSWQGLIQSAQDHDVAVTVTCTLFDSSAINTLIGNQGRRQNLINNLLDMMFAGNASGINIDFEGSNLHKENLILFMQELRAAMDAAEPGLHLSMATPSVDWTGCFDYDELGVVCDILLPMCYGYHWSGGAPGPVSPLTVGDIWGNICITATVDDYLDPGYGTTPDRLAIALPYYGRDWDVIGDPSIIPAQDGPGTAVARTYSYIRTNHEAYTKYWDPHSQCPWYHYSGDRQVWYDDTVSLGLKYDFVLDRDLAGIGIWALGYDGDYPDLWDLLETYFTQPPPTTTPYPTATRTPSPTSTPPNEPYYDLNLNKSQYTAGDRFLLMRTAYSSRSVFLNEWIILEAFGQYYFYPDWKTDADYLNVFLNDGLNTKNILSFVWPAGNYEPAVNLRFYGALTFPGTYALFADYDDEGFGFY